MCGGIHYGECEGLVSVERWSCGRGALCVVECTTGMAEGQALWDFLHHLCNMFALPLITVSTYQS